MRSSYRDWDQTFKGVPQCSILDRSFHYLHKWSTCFFFFFHNSTRFKTTPLQYSIILWSWRT